MGMFDTAEFGTPNLKSVDTSLGHFLNYKEQEKRKNMEMEKEMANFQSNLRLQEMDKAMNQQRVAKAMEPLNVVEAPGMMTPALQGRLDVERERNHALSDSNMLKNSIAQQNADTRRDLGYEGLETKRDIAGQTLATRENIAGQNNQTRSEITDKNIAGRESLEGTRQINRATNINTRGSQILDQIHARGGEDRQTKSTASPNTNANNPSQQAVAEKSRTNEFINRNPNLAKWVTFDPNTGMPSVTPPSTGNSMFSKGGPTQDEYHQILAGIYGQGSSPTYTNVPSASGPAGSNSSSDRVRVQLPNGQIGTMPRSQASQPGIKILGGG